MTSPDPSSRLHRRLGLRGALIVGLSAMLGTGLFAVWSPAWEWSGSLLLVAVLIAAVVAALNATSTARLARVHPESGGAYAYGRIRLNRPAGVTAGVAFLVGKSASAAAAALTIGVYVWPGQERPVAMVAILIALLIDLRGIVRSTAVNAILVAVLIAMILGIVIVGGTHLPVVEPVPVAPAGALAVIASAGIVFVAFAGYARITVLGEEVRSPARTIPLAMLGSFFIVLVIYLAVGAVVVAAGERGVAIEPAALLSIAEAAHMEIGAPLMPVAAVIGAGSVLINLLAGMGRTLFAMAHRGDAPAALSAVSARRVPHRAAIAAALLAGLLVLPGRLSWALALSGSCILTYYAVAHAASFTLPGRWPLQRLVPVAGLVLCLAVVGSLIVVVLTGPAG